MNWSQRLFLIRLGALATLILAVGSCFMGASSRNDPLIWIGIFLFLLAVIVGLGAKLMARLIFRWHYEGSVGPGYRIWKD